MTMTYDRARIEELRRMYPIGTKVQLISMADEKYAPPSGTIGEVWGVDSMGSLLVRWQNGSTLSLIPEADMFRVVDSV